jgi:TRAP-type C4-dicarboxylate transport system substrate-binding protein
MTKRAWRLAVGVSVLGFLSVQDARASNPKLTVRVATPFAAGHILADAAFRFEQELEAASNGKIEVVVATSVLNEQTINPAMTSCDPNQRVADLMLTGGQPIQDWAPQYFFFNGPYVIEDYDHFQAVWASHLGDEARALLRQNGNQKSLGTVYRGFRQFTSNDPITGPESFPGFRLRLPPVPDWVAVWTSLGVEQVIVPLGGIYTALQNGTADGSEGDLTQILSLRLYEVQTHLSLTSHLVGFGLATANWCFMDGLSNADEQLIEEQMEAATDWASARMVSLEAGLLSELQANGMTVVQPNAAAIRAAAEPAINDLFATKWTVTTWQEVLSY